MTEFIREKTDIAKGRYAPQREHLEENISAPPACTCVAISNGNGGYTLSTACPRHDRTTPHRKP
jgi:hypothetical protein